jgi:hypothetical protein
MAVLRVIVSKERAWEYDDLVRHFANVPECQVILDRRMAERRRGQGYRCGDRRDGERRSSRPHTQGAAVLLIH